MGRDLVNALPEWGLILIFVAATVLLRLGGVAVMRWRFERLRDAVSNSVVITVTSITMTFFALLLALILVNLYSTYKGASANVSKQADTLSQLIQNADAFPPAQEAAVRRAVDNYISEVRTREFPALRTGQRDGQSVAKLLQISAALRGYTPESQSQISFYNSAVSQVNELVAARDDLVGSAESAVPGALMSLLFTLAVISLVMTLFFKTHDPRLDTILGVALSAIIGLGLVTVLVLDYPFSGTIAISSNPLGEVARISGLTRGP